MTELLPPRGYFWFVIVMVWIISAGWALRDIVLLSTRVWKRRKENPDELFGCLMGIALGGAGVVGLIWFHFLRGSVSP